MYDHIMAGGADFIQPFLPMPPDYSQAFLYISAYVFQMTFYPSDNSANIKNLKNPSDAGVVTYINRSVYNYYCYKIKEIVLRKNEIVMTDLSTEQLYLGFTFAPYLNPHERVFRTRLQGLTDVWQSCRIEQAEPCICVWKRGHDK